MHKLLKNIFIVLAFISLQYSPINGMKKNFPCSQCSSCFTHPTHLKVHMRIHTGEKPFSCPYCLREFTQLGNCNKHVVDKICLKNKQILRSNEEILAPDEEITKAIEFRQNSNKTNDKLCQYLCEWLNDNKLWSTSIND